MDYVEHILELPERYALANTLWLTGMGKRDPTLSVSEHEAVLAFATPDGAVTVHGLRTNRTLTVRCYGPGRFFLESKLGALFGLKDRPDSFRPKGELEELAAKSDGWHLPRTPVIFSRLVQIILQQLVSWPDALRGWLLMTERFGSDAPGPVSLRLGPTPDRLKKLGYYDLVGCNIMPRQARLILQLANEAKRLERLAGEGNAPLTDYLLSIRGIGEWTVQHLLGTALGDSDAVLTEDYGLPHSVAWLLAGKERSNDEEMLQLLEPFAGHRFRVINWIWQHGLEAPRRGPKMRSNRWRFRGSTP